MSVYPHLLEEGRCWCSFNQCPYGQEFLKDLYSWSKMNPLNPLLVNTICVKCKYY